jgi:hypothetical protein
MEDMNETMVYGSGNRWTLRIRNMATRLKELPTVYPTRDETVQAARDFIQGRRYDRHTWVCSDLE